MKRILFAFATTLSIFSSMAQASVASVASEPTENAPSYCSAMSVDRFGKLDEQVRVECDSDYAGRCLQEVPEKNGFGWQIVDDKVCR
jgi:hypothetical protein